MGQEADRRLLEYRIDPREVFDVTSGRSGGARGRPQLSPVLPMILAAVTAAIVSTGVIALLAWPALPGPVGFIPVLGVATAAGVLAGRVLQRRSP